MEDRGKFQFRWAKGLCKEMSAGGCCFFILFYFILFYFSAGTPKTPSSLNKPVQGFSGKNVRSEKKKRLVSSNHDWLVIILYCISYMNYHFHARFFSVRTETYLRASVCCCGFLPCYHAIKFHPVERSATRSMLHSKRRFSVNCRL